MVFALSVLEVRIITVTFSSVLKVSISTLTF